MGRKCLVIDEKLTCSIFEITKVFAAKIFVKFDNEWECTRSCVCVCQIVYYILAIKHNNWLKDIQTLYQWKSRIILYRRVFNTKTSVLEQIEI